MVQKIILFPLTVMLMMSLLAVQGCATTDADTPANQTHAKVSNQELAKRMTDRLQKSLMLTEEQHKQVYDLNLQYMPEMRRVADSNEFRFKKTRELHQIEDKKQEQLEHILTPVQYQRYLRLQSEVLNIVRNSGHPVAQNNEK